MGPESDIPNVDGYRSDVLEALRTLKVPVLRWPGGCFADDYHWRDGIGPRESRPRMVNSNWGGTVEELAKWVEYMTAADGSQAELRAANGRREPWKVKYMGIGNETWGCGGNMTPEYYADIYKRYNTFARDYSGNRLYRIASGANNDDYNWTRVLMDRARWDMHAVSFHYYSVPEWDNKGSATAFSQEAYYTLLEKAMTVEGLIQNHIAVMAAYDPQKRVALLLDEWGTWYDVEPGTNPGHLFQQNTLRDAMVAALSLSASRDEAGTLHLSLVNPSLSEAVSLELSFDALRPHTVQGEILTAKDIHAFNAFGKAPAVAPAPFKGCKVSGGKLHVTLPAASIVVLSL